jgi:hypothetical protein
MGLGAGLFTEVRGRGLLRSSHARSCELAKLASYVLWAEGATRSRWYLGLRVL